MVYATGVQQQGRQYNITAETQYSDYFLPRQHYSILYTATAKPEYKETIRLRGGTQLVTIRQLQDHLKAGKCFVEDLEVTRRGRRYVVSIVYCVLLDVGFEAFGVGMWF